MPRPTPRPAAEHGYLRRTSAGDAEGNFDVLDLNRTKIGEILDMHENKDIGFDPECGTIYRLVGKYWAKFQGLHVGEFATVREAAIAIWQMSQDQAAAIRS